MSAMRPFPRRLEGRHVLFGLLAFFGVMFAANGVFLYYAVGTFNGFETRDAYRRGLTYNTRIASDAKQAARGWRPVARYDSVKQSLVLDVRDKAKRGVAGLSIRGEIRRPVTDRQDRQVTLSEVAPGRYAASLKLEPGQWVVLARMSEAGSDGVSYRLKQRLWVKKGR